MAPGSICKNLPLGRPVDPMESPSLNAKGPGLRPGTQVPSRKGPEWRERPDSAQVARAPSAFIARHLTASETRM
jgi:hypothetical protein